MGSAFSGLSNALNALNAQRYGLDVTGQNIANASTPGYTRQRAELSEVGSVTGVPAIFSTQTAATGVTISATSRLNDPVIDSRTRAENGRNSQSQATSAVLSNAESLFDEPSDTGLAEGLSGFWQSWTGVVAASGTTGDLPARTVVLEKATAVASSLNSTSAALERLTANTTLELSQTAAAVNTAAASVAKLNGAIKVAVATGAQTNALADQRDVALLQLANLAGGQATIQTDGSMNVTVGGETLVDGVTAHTFDVGASPAGLTVDGAATGQAGGTAQGLVDALNIVLPSYVQKFDDVAHSLAATVNDALAAGSDLAGNAGGQLFTGTTDPPGAGDISVAITDPAKLAASSTGGDLDTGVAANLALFGTNPAGADVAYSQLVGSLASEVQGAAQSALVQQSVTDTVNSQAQAMSGVNFDEETSNLLTYQRAYQAASRVLTTVDEMLDTLINRTGKVGL